MSDKFKLELSAEEMVDYIKRCPKQYRHELPEKLSEWCKHKTLAENLKRIEVTPVNLHEAFPIDPARQEIATRILVQHAPHGVLNIDSLVDYCVETADALLKKLRE